MQSKNTLNQWQILRFFFVLDGPHFTMVGFFSPFVVLKDLFVDSGFSHSIPMNASQPLKTIAETDSFKAQLWTVLYLIYSSWCRIIPSLVIEHLCLNKHTIPNTIPFKILLLVSTKPSPSVLPERGSRVKSENNRNQDESRSQYTDKLVNTHWLRSDLTHDNRETSQVIAQLRQNPWCKVYILWHNRWNLTFKST